MADQTTQLSCVVDVDTPLFLPTPAEVDFGTFEPFQTYTRRLVLRNMDHVRNSPGSGATGPRARGCERPHLTRPPAAALPPLAPTARRRFRAR